MAKFDQKERLAQHGGRRRVACKYCAGSYVQGYYQEHAKRAHLTKGKK